MINTEIVENTNSSPQEEFVIQKNELFVDIRRDQDYETRRIENIERTKLKILRSRNNSTFSQKSYISNAELPIEQTILTSKKAFLSDCLKKGQKVQYCGLEKPILSTLKPASYDAFENKLLINIKYNRNITYVSVKDADVTGEKEFEIDNETNYRTLKVGDEVCIVCRRVPYKKPPYIAVAHYKITRIAQFDYAVLTFSARLYDDMNIENWISPYTKVVEYFRKNILMN